MSRSSYAPVSQMCLVVGVDVAPSGCAPNAYKLFVGNIPRAYSEPDLLPVSALRAQQLWGVRGGQHTRCCIIGAQDSPYDAGAGVPTE